MSTLNTDLSTNLTQQAVGLQVVFQEPIANQTVQNKLQKLSAKLARYVQTASSNITSINNKVENNALDVGSFAQDIEKYEFFRWVYVHQSLFAPNAGK